ncbi:hypothetical protein GQ55_1G083500 [Panicum hallii var. hallii]|uniref:Embryo surrounding factor 1 brassicaceae domain-containing protein n=1 Tax=Panicum hallii var. hallii TaxID=1504633 RepID=A0A2T7F3J7_9POAL|nr:hypothetical protein GQ55_1G083500 [Panicum hallii var. hallii]
MDAKGMMAPIHLTTLLLACLASSAKRRGGDAERSAGGLRRRPDGEEAAVVGGSGKIYIVLCLKTTCTPGSKTCYCCHALPSKPCFWDQHECWSNVIS